MLERPFKTYSCSYYHDGAWWAIHITAYDFQDAETRAKKMNLRLDGETTLVIPALVPASGLFARIFTAIGNKLRKITVTQPDRT
jgi:hypothetical protein